MARDRSFVETEADHIDCDLRRLLDRTERLLDSFPFHRRPSSIFDALRGLRAARVGIRDLMSKKDRKETPF